MTPDLPFHEFFDLDTDWVGDATWQQFLVPVLYFPLKRLVAENTPRLMLVRRVEVPQFLTRYGIPGRRLPIWEHARPE